jgi:PAS domain S-box-containing protein
LDEQLFTAALADLVSLGLEQAARRLAEQQMRQSQHRTNLLVEGTPLAAIDWGTEGRIVGWNPAAERLFGYSRSEALGLSVPDLLAVGSQVEPAEGWRELKAGINLVERLRTRTRDGRELTCDWRNTLLCDEMGRELGIMSLIEDVTSRVQAEEEIRQLNVNLERRVTERTAQLAEANRQLLELDRLKNEFLATMSHELRTPLNSVIGFSSILKAGMAGPINEEQGRQLDMINQSARHLLGLINDLLDLSRIEAGHVRLTPTEFDPADVLGDVERTLRPMIEQKAALAPFRFAIVNNAVGLPILTDRTRLLQILINLANNAVKFTQEGSVTLELASDAQGLRFSVRDTGPGISAENLKHLFEAFRQVDGSARRAYEGTGLGLYLCKKLATLLGGAVSVQSEVGNGSCFSLWLPLRSTECAS